MSTPEQNTPTTDARLDELEALVALTHGRRMKLATQVFQLRDRVTELEAAAPAPDTAPLRMWIRCPNRQNAIFVLREG